MHGLKETLKKILSVSNFKCKERKKIYTGSNAFFHLKAFEHAFALDESGKIVITGRGSVLANPLRF